MRKKLSRTLAVLLVLGTLAACCISRSAPPTTKPDPSYVKELERGFAANPPEDDKIRIAIELIRQGSSDQEVRLYLLDEADEALAAEKKAADEWFAQAGSRVQAASSAQPVAKVRYSHDGIRTVSTNINDVQSEDLIRLIPRREPDARHLLPIVGISMSATPGDDRVIARLRAALQGYNVLHSSEAALGLARVKDVESISEIEKAANRFDERFLFANALTYFGNGKADDAAKRLLNNPKLFADLREAARLQNYDPYPQ